MIFSEQKSSAKSFGQEFDRITWLQTARTKAMTDEEFIMWKVA